MSLSVPPGLERAPNPLMILKYLLMIKNTYLCRCALVRYTRASDLPVPTDERVKLREVGGKVVGVIRYSGYSNDAMAQVGMQHQVNR
jgi:hypothetical protein